MSREIKFRAWHKKRDEMVDITVISLEADAGAPNGWVACPWGQGFDRDTETGEEDCVFPIEDVELMQYTGLKDKNGVEIYEADIVKTNSEEVGQVQWLSMGKWSLNIPRPDTDPKQPRLVLGGYVDKGCEVIGNIYENSELLKEDSE